VRWLKEAHFQERQFLRLTRKAFQLQLYEHVDRELNRVCRHSAIVNTDSDNYVVTNRVSMFCKLYAGGILGYLYTYFVAMKSTAEQNGVTYNKGSRGAPFQLLCFISYRCFGKRDWTGKCVETHSDSRHHSVPVP
jgi:hypothetical protein